MATDLALWVCELAIDGLFKDGFCSYLDEVLLMDITIDLSAYKKLGHFIADLIGQQYYCLLASLAVNETYRNQTISNVDIVCSLLDRYATLGKYPVEDYLPFKKVLAAYAARNPDALPIEFKGYSEEEIYQAFLIVRNHNDSRQP